MVTSLNAECLNVRAFKDLTVTRDDHSNTVHSQFDVFIPVGWGYSQLFGDIDVAPSAQKAKCLETNPTAWHLFWQLPVAMVWGAL